MFDTSELWAEVIEAAGPKKAAAAVGRDISTIYRWARSKWDVDPDGTGSNGLFDWFEAVVEVLAARPSARPTLRKLQLWSDALFRRVLDHHETKPLPQDELRRKAGAMLHNTADLLEGLSGGQVDTDRVVNVALETRELLERIIAAVEVGERKSA